MSTLVYNADQLLLLESARDFLTQEAPVAHFRKIRNEQHPDGLSLPLWKKFGYMGYAGILIPESLGGMALGHKEVSIVMQEIGRNLTPSPFFTTAILGATALNVAGSIAQQQLYLPGISIGESLLALAVDESPKHNPRHIALEARKDGGDFRLRGSKTFVVDGHIANSILVVARTGGSNDDTEGLTIFLVDKTSDGLDIERTVMVDSHNAARLTFNDVQVPGSAVLGNIDDGWSLLCATLNAGRLAITSELLGIADEVFTRTLAHLKERTQFGKLLGSFQALQHRLARLYVEIEMGRAALMNAARALDESNPDSSFLVSVAKSKLGLVASNAAREAVQMHGGMGISDEVDVGLYMKRVRTLDELFGDHRYHRNQVALANGY
ncbi:acyl-CoA dehydrogenase family protein [Paraburkholderia graminis]|uniref:acyl-CoA dehydrogenase family protein n=1 Tax=Paraburkholderia graminis TaxID=60548 RepID=UPI0038BDA3E8